MGEREGLPDRLSEEESAYFPNLADYQVTSPKNHHYNCIAYAAGDDSRWWEPTTGYYWPDGAVQGESLDALKSCFEAIGYEVCDTGELQHGYAKVALYRGDGGGWTHAARQMDSGEWTSKLGQNIDIRHPTPGCLRGPMYGAVALFMRKPEA